RQNSDCSGSPQAAPSRQCLANCFPETPSSPERRENRAAPRSLTPGNGLGRAISRIFRSRNAALPRPAPPRRRPDISRQLRSRFERAPHPPDEFFRAQSPQLLFLCSWKSPMPPQNHFRRPWESLRFVLGNRWLAAPPVAQFHLLPSQ